MHSLNWFVTLIGVIQDLCSFSLAIVADMDL